MRKFPAAVVRFAELVRLPPELAETWIAVGKTYEYVREQEEAVRDRFHAAMVRLLPGARVGGESARRAGILEPGDWVPDVCETSPEVVRIALLEAIDGSGP